MELVVEWLCTYIRNVVLVVEWLCRVHKECGVGGRVAVKST